MLKNHFKVLFDFRNRTVLLTTAFFAATVLVLTAQLIFGGYQTATKQAQQVSLNLSHVLEKETAASFEKIDLMLSDINRTFEFVGPKTKWTIQSYRTLLSKTARDIPAVSSIKILGPEGAYIGESDGTDVLPTANNSDRKYFQALKSNPDLGLYVSEPVISKTLKIWVIVLAKRLYSPDNKFAGVIIATISIDYFQKFFSQLNVGKTGNVTMLSYNEKILLARFPRKEDQLGKIINISSKFQEAFDVNDRAGNLHAHSVIDNTEKTFGYGINKKYNFVIITGLATIDYLASWRRTALSLTLSLIAGLLSLFYFMVKYLMSISDVENQRLRLIESAKMASLGEMAAGVAHEVNNPLAIIKGQSARIRDIIESRTLDHTTAFPLLDSIDNTVERIVKIVKGLRSFSRLGDKDLMVDSSLKGIIENSLILCSEKFYQNQVRLILNDVPDVQINCRETQLAQVLINLLSNAFDAALETSDKWVSISFTVKADQVLLCVTDSGNGISAELEKKIMQPFFTTKPLGKGTGLGLSISKGIIAEHHGRIYVNHDIKNTQFVCDLPLAKKNAA